MKKIISFFVFVLALAATVTMTSCSSSDDEPTVPDVSEKLVGTWVQSVEEHGYTITITYTLRHDGTYVAEDANDRWGVEETWEGRWSFDERLMKITFSYVFPDDDKDYMEYEYAIVSNDYKSFTMIDSDGELDNYSFIKKPEVR